MEAAKIRNELALRRDGLFKSVGEDGTVRWYYRERVNQNVVRRVFLNENA